MPRICGRRLGNARREDRSGVSARSAASILGCRCADGSPVPVGRIERWGPGPLGLNAGFQLDVALPCVSSWAELIVTHRPPFRIVAFNAAGNAVATHAPQGTGGEVTETIRLQGEGIARLSVYAAGNEKLVHSVCYACSPSSDPSAACTRVITAGS